MPEYRFEVTEVRRYRVVVTAWSPERAEEDARYFGFWHDNDGAIGKGVEIEHEEPAEVEVVPVSEAGPEFDHWVPPGPLPQFMQDLADELRPTPPERDASFWSDYGLGNDLNRALPPRLRVARCKHCNVLCRRRGLHDPSIYVHVNGLRACAPPLTTKAEPLEDDDPFDAFDFS